MQTGTGRLAPFRFYVDGLNRIRGHSTFLAFRGPEVTGRKTYGQTLVCRPAPDGLRRSAFMLTVNRIRGHSTFLAFREPEVAGRKTYGETRVCRPAPDGLRRSAFMLTV